MPLGSLPTLLMLLKSHAACTLHSSWDSSMDGNLTGITLERKSWAGCWLRTLAAAAQLPSADIFLGNLEQITSSPLALVSPFIQGNADCVSQCRCDVVTYHTQILCNGDTINSIATLSDPAVMSLPVWKLLQLIRKHSCPEIPFEKRVRKVSAMSWWAGACTAAVNNHVLCCARASGSVHYWPCRASAAFLQGLGQPLTANHAGIMRNSSHVFFSWIAKRWKLMIISLCFYCMWSICSSFTPSLSLMQHINNPLNIFVHHVHYSGLLTPIWCFIFIFWSQTNYKISRAHTYIPLWANRKEFPGYQWQHQTLLHKADITVMPKHILGEKPLVPLWWCESLSRSSTVCTPEFLTPQQQSQRGLLFLNVYYQILTSSFLFFHFISIQAALQGILNNTFITSAVCKEHDLSRSVYWACHH